jgi:deoxyadenosine/deoxycytidine kinase
MFAIPSLGFHKNLTDNLAYTNAKMGQQQSKRSKPEEVMAGMIHRKPRIITLDGNIGVGKTTLLEAIRTHFPDVLIVPEPVDTWTSLKDESGKNLLELFYEDKKRWAYTFQNAAILSRLRVLQDAVAKAKPNQIIITERSVLTDKYVFAAMLRESGEINALEAQLYDMWFDTFARNYPITACIYITTGVATAKERIGKRGRSGEDGISSEYLAALDKQHAYWRRLSWLTTLDISTEASVSMEHNMWEIERFFRILWPNDP